MTKTKLIYLRFNKLFQQLNWLINCCKNLSSKQLPFNNSLIEFAATAVIRFHKIYF